MAIAFHTIRHENERRYGTDIGRFGPFLLANRYDDQTHFIFELLQNAEDALCRRGPQWTGNRSVHFRLKAGSLELSHTGAPFTELDVRGICGIAESTKTDDLTTIGRFGIGFKSVYAYTDAPQVHSGDNHFEIENFVWPRAIQTLPLGDDETRFIFPLRKSRTSAFEELALALMSLGCRSLLFLKEINEVSWEIEGRDRGSYIRDTAQILSESATTVTVLGQRDNSEVESESWLIFGKPVFSQGKNAGTVEIAFSLSDNSTSDRPRVSTAHDSSLFVYFPTVLATNTGFIIQGPFRTTPSRDNIPRDDIWNKELAEGIAVLLIDSLRLMRNWDVLDGAVLECLPTDSTKFSTDKLLRPLYTSVKNALLSEDLIPKSGGGYISGKRAKLARSQELRGLLLPSQLTAVLGDASEVAWISEAFTSDRTPEVRRYFTQDLGVAEVRSEDILPKMSKTFLEEQSDEWITRLYGFLSGQKSVLKQPRILEVPWVRLENGSHVRVIENGRRQAFLPVSAISDFPKVRASVCSEEDALAFLRILGVTEPDAVDDLIANVLPLYKQKTPVAAQDYAGHIERIVRAFATDSKSQQDILVKALCETAFVGAREANGMTRGRMKPGELYLATDRFKKLFADVPGVLLVDDSLESLRGEKVRELMEACGVARVLEPIAIPSPFSYEERAAMRRDAGFPNNTGVEKIVDYTLRGLNELFSFKPQLDEKAWELRAGLLWESLSELLMRRGRSAFSGEHSWFHYTNRYSSFDAAFVKRLREVAWVPNRIGVACVPAAVAFDETGWKENLVLASILRFRPPFLAQLAKEAGIDVGVLALLQTLGATNVEQLKALLRVPHVTEQGMDYGAEDINTTEHQTIEDVRTAKVATGSASDKRNSERSDLDDGIAGGDKAIGPSGERLQNGAGSPPFISYVAVSSEDEGAHTGGRSAEDLIATEEKAIELILSKEPQLQRTPKNQHGFDLFEPGRFGGPIRWIEVKAMTSSLDERPVTLSHTQFEFAQAQKDRYWLYIVENVHSPGRESIAKIQDPAGKARSFTFDSGWTAVASRE